MGHLVVEGQLRALFAVRSGEEADLGLFRGLLLVCAVSVWMKLAFHT